MHQPIAGGPGLSGPDSSGPDSGRPPLPRPALPVHSVAASVAKRRQASLWPSHCGSRSEVPGRPGLPSRPCSGACMRFIHLRRLVSAARSPSHSAILIAVKIDPGGPSSRRRTFSCDGVAGPSLRVLLVGSRGRTGTTIDPPRIESQGEDRRLAAQGEVRRQNENCWLHRTGVDPLSWTFRHCAQEGCACGTLIPLPPASCPRSTGACPRPRARMRA